MSKKEWCVTIGVEVDFHIEAETEEEAIREAESRWDPTAYETEIVQVYEMDDNDVSQI